VEHACLNCGSAVDDGSPFCSSCGAAQIHLLRPESSACIVNVQRVAIKASLAIAFDHENAPLDAEAASADSRSELRSAMSAAAIAALLSVLPFGFLLALPLAGFLAVR
jgi:predicted  nucleic acid-binding Zn-ribbon protein